MFQNFKTRSVVMALIPLASCLACGKDEPTKEPEPALTQAQSSVPNSAAATTCPASKPAPTDDQYHAFKEDLSKALSERMFGFDFVNEHFKFDAQEEHATHDAIRSIVLEFVEKHGLKDH